MDMKRAQKILGLVTVLIIIALVSCTNGKGDVVIQNLDISGFDKVDIGTKGEMVLITDQNQFVEVHAQQNIINALKIWNDNGTLKVREKSGKNIGKYEELTIYVHAPSLREVKTSASANITGGNGIAHADFKAKTSASGNITITGMACQNVEAKSSASGNITLSGITDKADYDVSASGNIQAFNLISNDTKAKTSASGNIETTTNNTLNAKISASGNISYKGYPTIELDDSASGSLIDAN